MNDSDRLVEVPEERRGVCVKYLRGKGPGNTNDTGVKLSEKGPTDDTTENRKLLYGGGVFTEGTDGERGWFSKKFLV